MTGPELRDALVELFGADWPKTAPQIVGVGRSSLYRQIGGETPVQQTLVWGLENYRLVLSYRRRHNRVQARWKANKEA